MEVGDPLGGDRHHDVGIDDGHWFLLSGR